MITRARQTAREEYARLASRYDERWPGYIAATVRESLARLPDAPHARVLDVGCGTGALLEPLGRRLPGAALVGVDPVIEMLERAPAKLAGTATRAALVAARAEALPFRSASFDLLTSLSALHYFDDFAAAAREFHRVLEPGGTALITDWCADYRSNRLLDLGLRLLGKANFTVLGGEACRSLLEGAGFVDVRVERYRVERFWGMMTVRASR